MKLNFDHLQRCSLTLERSLQSMANAEPESVDYEVFRNAVIKSFELTLETAGKLLRKVLKAYVGSPKTVDTLVFKDLLAMPRSMGSSALASWNAGWFIAILATTPPTITASSLPTPPSPSSTIFSVTPSPSTKPCDKNMADLSLSLRSDHVLELRRLIATHLPHEEVWAYGSRVTGTAHDTSDLDLVVRHPGDLKVRQGSTFSELKEAFSESNLPFLIDLLDWARLPPAFWGNISEQHVVLYAPELHAQFAESAKREQAIKANLGGLTYGG